MMTLPENFKADLAALTAGPGSVSVSVPPRRAWCAIEDTSPLAVRFTRLELATDELAAATVDQLQAVAKNLAERVTYLLEPIGPIEVDNQRCVVQMRSLPPSRNENKHVFFELLVERGGILSLSRYAKAPGNVRQPIPADVTREVLIRLVDDFSAAIDDL